MRWEMKAQDRSLCPLLAWALRGPLGMCAECSFREGGQGRQERHPMVVSPLASPHVRVLCGSSKSVSFVPRGHWATSGNIFDCPNRRGWAVTCYYRLCIEARDIAGTLPWPG